MTSSSASLCIVLRSNADARLALLRLTWLVGREGDLAPPALVAGLAGRAMAAFPLTDALWLKLFTMLLTEPPPLGRGPLAAMRGPRVLGLMPPVLLVTDECLESDAFVGETLRDDAEPVFGDVGRLAPLRPSALGDVAGGEAGSGGGSLKAGRGSSGEPERAGGVICGSGKLGASGDSGSGEGSLNMGRGGKSSCSGGGSLNDGGTSAGGLVIGVCAGGSGERDARGGGGGIFEKSTDCSGGGGGGIFE